MGRSKPQAMNNEVKTSLFVRSKMDSSVTEKFI